MTLFEQSLAIVSLFNLAIVLFLGGSMIVDQEAKDDIKLVFIVSSIVAMILSPYTFGLLKSAGL